MCAFTVQVWERVRVGALLFRSPFASIPFRDKYRLFLFFIQCIPFTVPFFMLFVRRSPTIESLWLSLCFYIFHYCPKVCACVCVYDSYVQTETGHAWSKFMQQAKQIHRMNLTKQVNIFISSSLSFVFSFHFVFLFSFELLCLQVLHATKAKRVHIYHCVCMCVYWRPTFIDSHSLT